MCTAPCAALTAVFVTILVGWLMRCTTKDIAELSARQKHMDVRMETLRDYISLLVSCASATKAVVWYCDDKYLSSERVTPEQWVQAQPWVQPAHEALARVKYLGGVLVEESLRFDYEAFVAFIENALMPRGGDAPSKELWSNAEGSKNNPVSSAIDSASDLYRQMAADYPASIPDPWQVTWHRISGACSAVAQSMGRAFRR